MPRAYLAAIAWTFVILAACSIPGKSIPPLDLDLLEEDKLAHFSLFLIFGWLWARALPPAFAPGFTLIGLAGIGFGVATEIYQGLLPWERTPDPLDAFANIVGLLISLVVYAWRHRKKS